MVNAHYIVDIRANEDRTVDRLFIGPQHAQTARELEIIVRVPKDGSGSEAVVFHVMELGPKFRRMREENPDGV